MSERLTLFAQIILPLPLAGTFTYRVPFELNDKIKIGHRVVVPFGTKKLLSGIVASISPEVPNFTSVKYIYALLDEEPIVNEYQLRLWRWISEYYLCPLGEVMMCALPSLLRLNSETIILLNPDFQLDSQNLDGNEYLIVEALMTKPQLSLSEICKILDKKQVFSIIKKMVDRGIVEMKELLKNKYKEELKSFVRLSPKYNNDEALHHLMDLLEKRAYKQLEVLMAFFALGGSTEEKVSHSDLLKKADASSAIIKALVEKEVFISTKERVSRLKNFSALSSVDDITLTDAQQHAIDSIHSSFEQHRTVLLHGVTSSGKTEIYIKLIAEALSRNQQVLYLLPEIALTEHLINRLRRYFGDTVGVYHSRFGDNQRVEVWETVNAFAASPNPKYQIVLGSRSALFLPFSRLGLVIIDEEHDSSFKQTDPAPRYQGRDVATVLANLHGADVLMGSATPSYETYFNTQIGKYDLVTLSERFGGASLPKYIVDDLREERRRHTMKGSFFGETLINAISQSIENKRQSILFQNRRGFSPRIECNICKHTPQCINCDVSLTYHKQQNILKCHYCGYTIPVPRLCPECHSEDLKLVGLGTERVEEELSSILPSAKIDRLDLDSTSTKDSYQNILKRFSDGDIDILVGTQMVSKGLDFSNVDVVGIVDADKMLSFPDFRAWERAFQLMTQVAGRAGRTADNPGTVIIQTFQPTHPVIIDVINNDFLRLYNEQMASRKEHFFPPFARLITIRIKHANYQRLEEAAARLADNLKTIFGTHILGPEYPSVARIQNMYVKQLIVKFDRTTSPSAVKKILCERVALFSNDDVAKGCVVQYDVDP